MRNVSFIAAFTLLSSVVVPSAAAQSGPQAVIVTSIDLNRAKNYARQAAERANGGLNEYRAEFAMHGPATEAPYVTNPDGSWTFTFTGTVFGPTQQGDSTVQSIVTVTPDSDVRVEYNGPIR